MDEKVAVNYRPKVYTKETLDCPVIAEVDVLVVGGSQSGVAAAISCMRALKSIGFKNGKKIKILIVEQNNYLGGQSVTNMVSQWEIPAFRLNSGLWQIKGIGMEFIERIVKFGGSDKMWEDLLSLKQQDNVDWPFLGSDHHICGEEALNIEAIKVALLEFCEEEGVELLLDTRVVAAIGSGMDKISVPVPESGMHGLEGSEPFENLLDTVEGVVVEYFSGRGAITAKYVIDASANGLLPWMLGGDQSCEVRPYKKRGLTQSYLWIGGINLPKFVDEILKYSDEIFEFYPKDKEQFRRHAETGRLIYVKSIQAGEPVASFEAADEEEDLDILFKSGFPAVGFYAKWVGLYPGHGVFALDGPYYREDSLDGKTWTTMHTRNLYGSWGFYRILKHLPGWENAFVYRTCERMGLRTTRIPKGIYKIEGEDLKINKTHPDAIGVGDWHDQTEEGQEGIWGYHIPLRALVSLNIDNLAFCARAVSFGPGAMNAHRGIGTTIVCGQGAGVGTAVALASGVLLRNVDVEQVQRILKEQNVVLDIPSL